MSHRTRITALLAALLVFSLAASAWTAFELNRARVGLDNQLDHGIGLIGVVSDMTAEHLAEQVAFERALRAAVAQTQPSAGSLGPERAVFEARAETVAEALAHGRAIVAQALAHDGRQGERYAQFGALLEGIGSAHEAYLEDARTLLASLEVGRSAVNVDRLQTRADSLRRGLATLLTTLTARSRAASQELRVSENRAFWITLALAAATVLLTLGVFIVCVRLLAEARSLGGLLPICFSCKKIRDDGGYWTEVEAYVESHSDAEFTHGLCSECQAHMHAELERLPGNPREPGPPAVTASGLREMSR